LEERNGTGTDHIETLMNRDKTTLFEVDTTAVAVDVAAPGIDLAARGIDSVDLGAARSDIRAVGESIRLTSLEQATERAKLRPEFGVQYTHMLVLVGRRRNIR